ncbi:transposase [Occallatibacter riparius]|uniref:Transposase n=1 Tax=Occallatibacter riparius TaxID=1002689 RepID=A0A9J7BQE0_9BACT|nr:transposase [Occallatibacter riparius]UWZ83962.1 transposase [Occallatibacter riparius]
MGQKKSPPVLAPAGVVFLVNSIVSDCEGKSAIIFDLYVADNSATYKLFFEIPLDKIFTGTLGGAATQGIENFWSLLKRTLNGTYVAVEPFHLSRYADAQAFQFNNRATRDNKLTDGDRFALVMSQMAGNRLSYSELIGKETDALH